IVTTAIVIPERPSGPRGRISAPPAGSPRDQAQARCGCLACFLRRSSDHPPVLRRAYLPEGKALTVMFRSGVPLVGGWEVVGAAILMCRGAIAGRCCGRAGKGGIAAIRLG